MLAVTWNVNSIRARLGRLIPWLESHQPDLICFQETKVLDQDFPFEELQRLGYTTLSFGQKTYNGVAVASRSPVFELQRGLPGDESGQARLLAAQVGEVAVVNVYVPNGQEVGTETYAFKLRWLAKLQDFLTQRFSPESKLLLCGDFNVAPEEVDVWDPEGLRGKILFSDPEREAFRQLLKWGLVDCLRLRHPHEAFYTWWDYRQGAFHRGWGMRLDHVLATPPLAACCQDVVVDRQARKGEKPSDHAPVLATFSRW